MNEHLTVRRATHDDLASITSLVQNACPPTLKVDQSQVQEWLFSKGLWVALQDDTLVGAVAWQAENLVSVTDVFYVFPPHRWADAGHRLLESLEAQATTLMCEVNVVLLPSSTLETTRAVLIERGYTRATLEELHRIWQEVLVEFVDGELELMVKPLRDRMVMVPL
jgi:N-acetylglutamate synthase-like GNAT family acetyltransferase